MYHLATNLEILTKSIGDFAPEGKDSFLISARWQERAQTLISRCRSGFHIDPFPPGLSRPRADLYEPWKKDSESILYDLERERARESKKYFAKWLEGALEGGSRAANQVCNVCGQLPQVPQHKEVDGILITDLDSVMESRRHAWMTRWSKHDTTTLNKGG
eukprot:8665897-Heterocapsa_arctica.AAC.1